MAKFHLVALDPPAFRVYFSEGDPSITMGRAGAGNRVTLDCEEDIYCRLLWENGELWLRGDALEDRRLRGEVTFEVCGRRFKGSMVDAETDPIKQPLPQRVSPIQSPLGAARSLQGFFKNPLLRIALFGPETDAFLKAWCTFPPQEDGAGRITRLTALPGSRLLRPDAGQRQALQEFQRGNEWMKGRGTLEDARFVFGIRRPGKALCYVEVMANAGESCSKSFRNFSAHAHGLWLHAPEEEVAVKQGMDFLVSLENAESDVQRSVRIITSPAAGLPTEWRQYFSECLGEVALGEEEGPPTFQKLASFVDQLMETVQMSGRKKRQRLIVSLTLLGLLMTGLLVAGGKMLVDLSARAPIDPNVQEALKNLENELAAQTWNGVILFLDESYVKMSGAPTEWAEFSRESEKLLRQVLEPMTYRQIASLPATPEKMFLNVIGSLKDRPEPFRTLAKDQEQLLEKFQMDHRVYRDLLETYDAWRSGVQNGMQLKSGYDRYLERKTIRGKAVMDQEVEALKTWVERPRNVEVEMQGLDWHQGEPAFIPEKLLSFEVRCGESTAEVGPVKMQAGELTQPEGSCAVVFSDIGIFEDALVFTFELSARHWGDWKLPKTEQVFAESRVEIRDFFIAEKGVFSERISPLTTRSGEAVGSLLIQFDMEMGEAPPVLPGWRLTAF